jgi:hypothetical protein
MGASARSTVGTATDANAVLRVLFSRFGKPYRLAQSLLFQRPVGPRGRADLDREGRREDRETRVRRRMSQ